MPSPPAPSSGAFRGASLYSGIFDQASDGPSIPASETKDAPKAETALNQTPATATTGWSASLRFAPRRNTAAGKNKPRPNAAFVTSLPPPADDHVTPASSSPMPTTVVPTKVSPAVPAVPEVTPTPIETGTTNQESLDVLLVELQRYPVLEAPPYTLPPEVLQLDRQMARKAAEERGDIAPRDHSETQIHERDLADDDADEDVNGFMATNAGKRAASKRRKRRKKGNSPPPGPSLNADYDPRIPNDYLALKQEIYERRQAHIAHQRWLRDCEQESASQTQMANLPLKQQHSETSEQKSLTQDQAMTGEEVYARRLAMSQRDAASSDFVPVLPSAKAATSASSIKESDIAASRNAAAAIAARLTRSALPAQTLKETEDDAAAADSSRPFAERLMAKYGYVQGQGIGAEGNKGILEPLQHIQAEKSKGAVRGTITNSNIDPKASEEAVLYGSATSSSVIVLLNMVTQADLYQSANGTEQDGQTHPDVIQDIAEECAKFGIVNRIFAHISPCLDRDIEGGDSDVRVFVQFTGAAGGWKAVRALNGRWFQGRLVRALYYSATAFEDRDLDRVLHT